MRSSAELAGFGYFLQHRLMSCRSFIFRSSNTEPRSSEHEVWEHELGLRNARRGKTAAADIRPAEGPLHSRSRRLSLGFERQALSRFPQRHRRERAWTWASGNSKSAQAADRKTDPHV